jgi:hypothetical protein
MVSLRARKATTMLRNALNGPDAFIVLQGEKDDGRSSVRGFRDLGGCRIVSWNGEQAKRHGYLLGHPILKNALIVHDTRAMDARDRLLFWGIPDRRPLECRKLSMRPLLPLPSPSGFPT